MATTAIDNMITELEKLDTRGRALTPEEERRSWLMSQLIHQFEESRRVRVQQRRLRRTQWQTLAEQDARAQAGRVLPRPCQLILLAAERRRVAPCYDV